MPYKLRKEPTNQDIHKIATLAAAGVSFLQITLATGLGKTAVDRVMARPEYTSILASKKAAMDLLMTGGI